MSDPRRLLDDPGTPSEAAELVRSLEAPASMADAVRSTIGTRVARSAALVPAAAAKLAPLKLVGASAVAVGGAVALSLGLLAPPEAPAPPPAPVVADERAAPPPKVAPPEAEAIAPPAPAPALEPVSKAPSSTPRAPSKKDTLALEEALLEQARRASRESPARALSLLQEHERRFPSGELTAERLYLTAQAHRQAGNVDAARRYAKLLSQRFPRSTYLPRLRPLLDAASSRP